MAHVVVSGVPGAGKSTVAGSLANEVVLSVAESVPPSMLESFWRHERAVDQLQALPSHPREERCDQVASRMRTTRGSTDEYSA